MTLLSLCEQLLVAHKENADLRLLSEKSHKSKFFSVSGTEVTVTGVMKPFTSKSSFDYDVMFSHELHREWMGYGASDFSLVKLHRAEDLATINAWQKPQKPSWFGNTEIIYQLIPYKDNYFMHNITIHNSDSFFKKGDKNSIRILVFVAVLLFLIGFVPHRSRHSRRG